MRIVWILLFLSSIAFADAVEVKLDTAESDAVLAILEKTSHNQSVIDSDWQRLFATPGYVRLKKREESMKRSFNDEDFKKFVLSPELSAKAADLKRTLENWKSANVDQAAQKALSYLPQNAQIKATIYPVIKPKTNSFVFEADTNPAIFLYLDPAESKEKFENTLAHELHHIGYASSCNSENQKHPKNVQNVINWMSAFGEGVAMLAAAGGPDVHPHAVSKSGERERWDRDLAHFNTDLKKVEQFFNDTLGNKLSEEEMQKTGFSFFGIQGPWYTVGWKMAVTIEKAFGRQTLIDSLCNHVQFLSTYNRAVKASKHTLATWSPALLKELQ